jgi:hypothetical protein
MPNEAAGFLALILLFAAYRHLGRYRAKFTGVFCLVLMVVSYRYYLGLFSRARPGVCFIPRPVQAGA